MVASCDKAAQDGQFVDILAVQIAAFKLYLKLKQSACKLGAQCAVNLNFGGALDARIRPYVICGHWVFAFPRRLTSSPKPSLITVAWGAYSIAVMPMMMPIAIAVVALGRRRGIRIGLARALNLICVCG